MEHDGILLSSLCGVLRREISPSRMSIWPCRTGRMRFFPVGSAAASDFAAAALGFGGSGMGFGGDGVTGGKVVG